MNSFTDADKALKDFVPLEKWKGKDRKQRKSSLKNFRCECSDWLKVFQLYFRHHHDVQKWQKLENTAMNLLSYPLTEDLGVEALGCLKLFKVFFDVKPNGKKGRPEDQEDAHLFMMLERLLIKYSNLKQAERHEFIQKWSLICLQHPTTPDGVRKLLKRKKDLTPIFDHSPNRAHKKLLLILSKQMKEKLLAVEAEIEIAKKRLITTRGENLRRIFSSDAKSIHEEFLKLVSEAKDEASWKINSGLVDMGRRLNR